MPGIVFFDSAAREETVAFYTNRVGADVWLEQSGCTILKYDKLLFGFCDRDAAETDGVVTFVTDTRAGVDAFYEEFAERARGEPVVNEDYDIYQFFAADPEGRTIEFQTFLHETPAV